MITKSIKVTLWVGAAPTVVTQTDRVVQKAGWDRFRPRFP